MATAPTTAAGRDRGDNARQIPWKHGGVRWALSLLSVALAAGIVEQLRGKAEPPPNAIFFCAIIFAAWFGGSGPGVLATVLSVVMLEYFAKQALHLWTFSAGELVSRALFVATGFFICWLTGRQKRAAEALRALTEALEGKVAARTAELSKTNEELTAEIAERKKAEAALEAAISDRARMAALREEVGATLANRQALQEMLQHGAEALVRHLDAAFARIWTLDGQAGELQLQASAGMYTRLDGSHSRIPVGQFKIGLIAQQKKPHLTNDVQNDPRISDKEWARRENMVAFAGYPLCLENRAVGVMAIFSHNPLPESTIETLSIISDALAQGIERKQAEEGLRTAETNLAHVARVATLGEMSASIAHEVNQPLTAIVNNANACLNLLGGGLEHLGEVRAALEEIAQDGQRAAEVIERIRALVKKSPPKMAPCDLRALVNEVTALALIESTGRGVSVKTELGQNLPVVRGDAIQLQQILLNLVMNGMEAMAEVERSARILEIGCRRQAREAKAGVIVEVRDYGIGIQAQEMGRIFNAFYSTKPHGLGMGLAISRSLVESHGGRLWASSNQGPGATFAFWLPAMENAVA